MDSGSQLTAAEFKDLVRRFALAHLRIRTYHPESNGVIEWFHWSTRDALAASDPQNLTQARTLIGTWVTYYNEKRLHAALGYLPPAEYYRGNTGGAAAGTPAEAQSGTSGTTANEHGAAPTGRVMEPVKCIFGMELKTSECAETLHCPHRLNPSLLILSIRSC